MLGDTYERLSAFDVFLRGWVVRCGEKIVLFEATI